MSEYGANAVSPVRKETTFENATSKIFDCISSIENQVDRAESSVSRLLNPRPEKDHDPFPPDQTPDSHEATLGAIARRLERLLNRANQLAARLSEAI